MLAMLGGKPLAIVNVAVFYILITPQQHFNTTPSPTLQMPNINKTA